MCCDVWASAQQLFFVASGSRLKRRCEGNHLRLILPSRTNRRRRSTTPQKPPPHLLFSSDGWHVVADMRTSTRLSIFCLQGLRENSREKNCTRGKKKKILTLLPWMFRPIRGAGYYGADSYQKWSGEALLCDNERHWQDTLHLPLVCSLCVRPHWYSQACVYVGVCVFCVGVCWLGKKSGGS